MVALSLKILYAYANKERGNKMKNNILDKIMASPETVHLTCNTCKSHFVGVQNLLDHLELYK